MSSPVREGEVLAGKYRVERTLGVGGMGVVVEARHIQLDDQVALKFLLPDALEQPELVARFQREARAAVKIKGEHVAKVLDVGELESGAPFMVMEFLKGGDLEALIERRGAVPSTEAVDYIMQACEAMAEAHALGIVHRDLKPANLFLSQRADGSPIIKVLDFGISKALKPGEDPSVTKTTAVMGSPLYMSPEQLRATRDVDPRTDIWSLGVILYELLVGATPFLAPTMPQLCSVIMSEPPLPIAGEVPEGLVRVVMRCLEKDPAARYANVAEFATDLCRYGKPNNRSNLERIQRILEAAGVTSGVDWAAATSVGDTGADLAREVGRSTQTAWESKPAPSLVPQPSRSSRGVLLGLGLGLGAFVLVGLFFVLKPSSEQAQAEVPVEPTPTLAPVVEEPTAGHEALISVSISANQAGAKLFLDDAEIANPFVAQLPPDSRMQTLRVEAPQFKRKVQKIQLDKDLTVAIELEPEPVVESKEPKRTTSSRSQPKTKEADSAKKPVQSGTKLDNFKLN